MIAIPVVDFGNASAGRSSQPARAGAVSAGTHSALIARALSNLGFTRLHLEDAGSGARTEAVEEIIRDTDASVQVAGANSGSEIERLFRTGAEYIVVGDRSIEEPEWLSGLAELYPDSIVVRSEVRDRRVVRRGWVRTLPVDVLDLVDDLNALPLGGILLSGFQLDGPTRQADLALIEDLAERSRNPIIVSARLESVNDLRTLEHRGASAAVLRADPLLSGTLDGRMVAREFGS